MILERNIRHARTLQALYSSPASKLTDFHMYSYHSIVTVRSAPVLSGALREIAVAEMRHMQLLGECILALGLHPTLSYYQGTRKARWSSGFVEYAKHPRGMIELALRHERESIARLQGAVSLIGPGEISALLERLIADEECHIKCLCELLDNLS